MGEPSLRRIPIGNLVIFLALSPLPAIRSCQADERDVSPQPWGLRGARVQGPGIFVSLCLPFLLTVPGGKGEEQRATLWDCWGATHSWKRIRGGGKREWSQVASRKVSGSSQTIRGNSRADQEAKLVEFHF